MSDRTIPASPVAGRPSGETRRPFHVGVALGLTASVYAGSLAAVSLLQIDRDRGLTADRQPVSDAIVMLGRHHDEMAASLERAGAVFEAASTRYDQVAADYQELHTALVSLGRKLKAIDALTAVDGSGLGSVSLGSGGGKLPSVSKAAPRSGGTTSAPATSATTGASGAP
jgi:hypothetical protein